ncbi:MAG: hypothetical protein NTY73_04490 [Candidatus Micrarchaeota archaeon]|nr:hypothetical protein [Candidatus Micrarchaeota archaeon]
MISKGRLLLIGIDCLVVLGLIWFIVSPATFPIALTIYVLVCSLVIGIPAFLILHPLDQKKDKHENRNAGIVGFLLAVIDCAILLLSVLLRDFHYGLLIAFLLIPAYQLMGPMLYLISLEFKTRFNLRFWAKCIFFGGIISLVLASFLMALLTFLFLS